MQPLMSSCWGTLQLHGERERLRLALHAAMDSDPLRCGAPGQRPGRPDAGDTCAVADVAGLAWAQRSRQLRRVGLACGFAQPLVQQADERTRQKAAKPEP